MQLIINGDDFGLSQNYSRNILKCFDCGVLSSTSVIVNYPDNYNMIEELSSRGIDCGLHLNISSGISISRKKTSITDDNLNFFPPPLFFLKYQMGKIRLEDIFEEFTQQTKKILEFGITPTHLDVHHHLQLIPQIHKVMETISKTYNIRHIRTPKNYLFHLSKISVNETIKSMLLLQWKLKKISTPHPVHTIGFFQLNEETVQKNLNFLSNRNEVFELITHPEDTNSGFWNKLLTSKEFKNFLHLNNIEVINFSHIAK